MKKLDRESLRDSLRTQLWPVPLIAVVLAVALGQFMPFLDHIIDGKLSPLVSGFLFGGGPEAGRSLLETIASSMITVTSLTFSLTVVTLQLASSQFSPRLLRTFTSDRFVHNTLALFLATFSYALTVLRSIRVETSAGSGFVPELAVTLAFLLTLASVVGLVLFLAHLARQIRVETMLRDVHRASDHTLDRIFPRDRRPAGRTQPPVSPGATITIDTSGFLLGIGRGTVLAAAKKADAFVMVDSIPGDSLVYGMPFARAWALDGSPLEASRLAGLQGDLNDAARIGFERTSTQDVAFGLQQLLDVTNKALSPGVNDPTTAVHALSHVSAVLCAVGRRSTGPETLQDDDGRPRVVLTYPTATQLLDLAMDQVLTYAFSDPRTAARTLQILEEVFTTASPDSMDDLRPALLRQARRCRAAIEASDLEDSIRAQLLDTIDELEQTHA
ncbi:Predicted membrane protein (DUF2254) [Arthrobacter agilis]|uniref:DUF2254 domain-containing protein n=1 Tax=Arthrobacter agilis TaxID=37921 RepID=UPI000B5654BC|nr:DUF2254 domain-containing protein [Arthrobacter agilis]OUM44763.1 hypothetical protein B8W74_02425 [Arthrobacter agilis]VDR32319.1 Predicted membrane protein (DUF2254) [Arthrobacter agilis]